MIITLISDTHNKHKQITEDLPGGDILIHAGDISSMGYKHEIEDFCKWFNELPNYDLKVFIAGNHDWGFVDKSHFFVERKAIIPESTKEILKTYKWIDHLQDNSLQFQIGDEPKVHIYGSPWQPEFFGWAFNLTRESEELRKKWSEIPSDVDILITHGPAYGYVDRILGNSEHLGCELLTKRIKEVKPKIHVCGHIHSGYGYTFDGDTHYINAAVLNERYAYANKPLTVEWDPKTNKLEFI